MANTRKLDSAARRQAKRQARKALRALHEGLSKKQRSELRKSEKGIKAFLEDVRKAAEKSAGE
ncbi:MAG: hypothetical protein H6707_06535 [Deltaproteobacteria bacterium]|nr:hypothetical protein [Deltaproteobacteria bacterium]